MLCLDCLHSEAYLYKPFLDPLELHGGLLLNQLPDLLGDLSEKIGLGDGKRLDDARGHHRIGEGIVPQDHDLIACPLPLSHHADLEAVKGLREEAVCFHNDLVLQLLDLVDIANRSS